MKKLVNGFIMIAISFLIMSTASVRSFAQEVTDTAMTTEEAAAELMTEESTVKKKKLTQDTDAHTFSNASDGTFQYSYAVKSDYYLGKAVDNSTGIKYIFISYDDKVWAVVYSNKGGFRGSYDTSSYISLGSESFNMVTTETQINIIKNKTGNEYIEECFYYGDDYSVITTGFSSGIYYINCAKAKGIKLVDGVYYYFKNGVQVVKKGWYKSGKSYIYVTKKQVKYKFTGKVCYKYTGGKKKKVKNTTVNINGTSYKFNSKGNLYQGFVEVSGDYYYYVDGVSKTNYYKKVNGYGYYFGSDGKAVKKQWVKIKNRVFYFGAKGRNTKLYYTENYSDSSKAGKYKIYKSGKWKWVDKGVYKINGEYKFFKNGKVYTSSCWYDEDSSTSYYIKSGVVLYKRKASGSTYILYERTNNKWVKAKNIWTPAKKGELMYFDASGKLVYKYFNSSYRTSAYRETFWKYNQTKSKWTKQKNTLVEIKGYYYYASSTGTLYTTAGWHTISDTSAVYTNSSGKVSEYVYYSEEKGYSIYKTGYALGAPSEGIVTVTINSKTVYYLVDSQGRSSSGSYTINGYIYEFDKYGRAYSRRREGSIYWNTDEWMARVITEYLGVTNMFCNVFVSEAFALAGGTDYSITHAVKYESAATGGILLNSSYTSSDWASASTVKGNVVLSDGTGWLDSETIELNSDIVDFSYSELTAGDVIVYYKSSTNTPSHVAIYLGQFEDANAVIEYLEGIGISESLAKSCVKDWGKYYNNDSTYWCIHGGMGSSNQVYISNSTYCIPVDTGNGIYTFAKKIVNVID